MKKVICIILLICTFMLCFVSCGSSGNNNGVCGICGGRGVVTNKFLGEGSGIQSGFDTYYRCGGCHGTGRSK